MLAIRSLCSLGVLAGALVLAIPGMAVAKGPGLDHAVLEGPGIDQQITLTDRYPYMLNETVLSLAFGSSRDSDISRDHPPSNALGPRYELVFHMAVGEPITVDLYPYAEAGPRAYAPAGLAIGVGVGNTDRETLFRVNPGWYELQPRLVSELRDQGLPSEKAALGTGWRLPGWFLVLALLVLGARLWRQRVRWANPRQNWFRPAC
jgi:hypothetical protein